MTRRSHSISRYSEPQVIADISTQLEASGVSTIEITAGDGNLMIISSVTARSSTSAVRPAVSKPAPTSAETSLARAPIAGNLLVTHPLRRESAITSGQSVKAGDAVAFIKVGPVLVPVTADKTGTAGAFTAEPDTLVGYGSPLLQAKG